MGNVFDILIKFGLSKEKATEAVQELKKVEDQGKRTGNETAKATDKATASFKDSNRALQVMSGRLGQVGQVLQYVFNPALVGAAALGVAIKKVWAEFQTFLQGLKDSSVNAAKAIGDIRGAMHDLDLERIKADAGFKRATEDFERQTARKIELIKLERETVLELLKAREQAELASAGSDEERAAIKSRYGAARRATDSSATAQEIATQRAALDAKEAAARQRFAEGTALAGGRTPERTALDLKNLPDSLKSLDDQIAEQERVVGSLSGITTVAGALPYWNDPENYMTQVEAFRSSQRTLAALKKERDRVAGREKPLTQAATLFGSADTMMGEVRRGREDVSNLAADSGVRERTGFQAAAILEGAGSAADLVANAAAGADAIRGGGRANAAQSAAMKKAVETLGLQKLNQEEILAILGRMNDSEKAFRNSLNVIKQQQ